MDASAIKSPVNHEIDVSVIVVTYNSAECIKTCVYSVLAQEGLAIEVIVIDNVSADKTIEKVREIDGDIILICNHENVGFGRACNQGVASSSGKYVMLLNPDAAFDDKDSLSKLCKMMGASTARLRYLIQNKIGQAVILRHCPGPLPGYLAPACS